MASQQETTKTTESKSGNSQKKTMSLRFHPDSTTKEAGTGNGYHRGCRRAKSEEGGSSKFNRRRNSRRGTTSYRRWSSRRRFSRRMSRIPSDEFDSFDEMALMQTANGGVGSSAATVSCLNVVPMRPHGLCVAILAIMCSLVGVIGSAMLLLRNLVLSELAKLPPGCKGYHLNVSLVT